MAPEAAPANGTPSAPAAAEGAAKGGAAAAAGEKPKAEKPAVSSKEIAATNAARKYFSAVASHQKEANASHTLFNAFNVTKENE